MLLTERKITEPLHSVQRKLHFAICPVISLDGDACLLNIMGKNRELGQHHRAVHGNRIGQFTWHWLLALGRAYQ